MGYQKLALFLLYIAFLCQLVSSSSLPHLCPSDQALALLQFKHMFTINAYANSGCTSYQSKVLSWNKSTDCCSWGGVHCEETTGQVIELDLWCSGLQGKFDSNSSLFQLANLKMLDLSFNNFSGSLISPKFGEFSSLTHLNLSDSGFSGQIPSEISHLSKLYALHIWNFNPFGLKLGPHNFELLLKNLTQLRELDLSYVNISSTFPLNFSSFLTTLGLENTQLFGILPERVFHLSDLKYLGLSLNSQLTVGFPTTKWNSSASLIELSLSGVNFTGRISESFRYLTSLQFLLMSSCNISGPIPKPIWNLTSIEYLSLRGNNLNGQIECLSCNQSWTQLDTLDFSSNSLTGLIPSCIFSLPSLTDLHFSNNSFTGKIQDFKSETLRIVALKHNQLQGPISKSLLNQQSLEYVLLSQNNLSGQIDSTVCNLKIVRVLDLGSNNLEGSIPQCLGEMSELWVLDVSNNSLSGTINTTFRIGNQLEVIKLEGNKLQGKVPPSLINCTDLELLDLGNNELIDTFPKWLGALPALKILILRSNRLHGSIQASRNEKLFAQLRVIDLSSNGFSGNLPVNLFENFEAMKLIDEKNGTPRYVAIEIGSFYYECSLMITTKGSYREFVRVLTSNIVIDLSRNRFEGYIPSIIGDLIGLRTLNLSHNGLEGVIPTSLQYLSVLESLDLSFNKIGGEIPQQLASLTSLAVLNLSHNHLVGCIPKGNQFATFENSSYQGNDGLRGFPLSKDCGVDDGVPQATTSVDQGEEGDSAIISWQAFLMGYGCGLVVVLSVIYIMLATQSPAWFSRMVEELEHKSIARMKKHKKRY